MSAREIDPATAGETSGLFTKFDACLVHAALRAGSPVAVYRRPGEFYLKRALQMSAIRSRLLMPLLVLLLALRIQPLRALIGGTISSGAYLAHTAAPHRVGRFFYAALVVEVRARPICRFAAADPAFALSALRPADDAPQPPRFFESLALLLEAGVSMLDALSAALATVEIGAIRRDLARIAPRIEKGAGLAGALADLTCPRH